MSQVFKNESKEFNDGYDRGYASGRKFYVNDIKIELGDINTAISCLKKYKPELLEVIEDLENTHKILTVVLEKAKSKKFLE